MKKDDNVYDLYNYQFARKVVKDIPKILEDLDKITSMCYTYREYRSIASLLEYVNEVKLDLENHLKFYKRLKEKKGKK